MTATLRSNTYSKYLAPEELDVADYFKEVEAENWKLKHYLNYRLENENVIPPWLTFYNDWKSSLEIIKKTNNKKIPVSVCSFCEELSNVNTFEGSSIVKSCMEWYDEFHDRYFDLQLAERV